MAAQRYETLAAVDESVDDAIRMRDAVAGALEKHASIADDPSGKLPEHFRDGVGLKLKASISTKNAGGQEWLRKPELICTKRTGYKRL